MLLSVWMWLHSPACGSWRTPKARPSYSGKHLEGQTINTRRKHVMYSYSSTLITWLMHNDLYLTIYICDPIYNVICIYIALYKASCTKSLHNGFLPASTGHGLRHRGRAGRWHGTLPPPPHPPGFALCWTGPVGSVGSADWQQAHRVSVSNYVCITIYIYISRYVM